MHGSFYYCFCFLFFDFFLFLILQIVSIQFEFMDTYCPKELHNTRSDDVVINKLENLIVRRGIVIDSSSNEEQ